MVNMTQTMMSLWKNGSSVHPGLYTTPSVAGQTGDSDKDSRRAVNGCGVMTTSMISVAADVVSPPLVFILPYSAIESGGCAAGPSSSSTLSCTLQFIQGVANPPRVIMLINYPRQTPLDNDSLPIASAYPVIFVLAFCPALTPLGGERVTSGADSSSKLSRKTEPE